MNLDLLKILAEETNYFEWLQKLNLLPENTDLFGIVKTALFYATVFSGLVVFAFLVYGGYQYITSAGNPEGAKKATSTLTWAIIGLVIILAASVIVSWLLTIIQKGSVL